MMTDIEVKLFDLASEVECTSSICTLMTKCFEGDDTAYCSLSGLANHQKRISDDLANIREDQVENLGQQLFDLGAEIEMIRDECYMILNYFEDNDTAYSSLSGIAKYLERISAELYLLDV